MTGEDASELRKVRAASYGAACCIAVLAFVAATLPMQSRVVLETMPSVHAVLVTEAPRLIHTPEVQQEISRDSVAPARSTTNAGDGVAPRLWSYSPAGEIVFDWPEQYERCRLARARGASEADCPNPGETRDLVLRDDGAASFDLRRIILAAGD